MIVTKLSETPLSNTQFRKLRKKVEQYSIDLGLKRPKRSMTAKEAAIRICLIRPEIGKLVRPEGGKLTQIQQGRFLSYMLQNPLETKVVYLRPPKPKKKYISSPDKNESTSKKKAFYASWDWRTLRMKVLLSQGHRCKSCGATTEDVDISGKPVRLVVDHIKPISKYWELRLDKNNLQVLCDECNMGKGAWDETDFRTGEAMEQRK